MLFIIMSLMSFMSDEGFEIYIELIDEHFVALMNLGLGDATLTWGDQGVAVASLLH